MGYKLADGVILENVDGTSVFLKDNGDAAVPNHVGGVVVKHLLLGGLGICVEYVVENYEVSYDEARADIEEFARELKLRGLTEEVDE